MDKQKINKAVDGLMFLAFLVTMFSVIVMPEGGREAEQKEFWGVARHTWSEIHSWSGTIMAILVVAHIILHWNFIISSIKNIFKKDNSIQENKNI